MLSLCRFRFNPHFLLRFANQTIVKIGFFYFIICAQKLHINTLYLCMRTVATFLVTALTWRFSRCFVEIHLMTSSLEHTVLVYCKKEYQLILNFSKVNVKLLQNWYNYMELGLHQFISIQINSGELWHLHLVLIKFSNKSL